MSMRNPGGFIRPSYNPLEVADAPTSVTPAPISDSVLVDFTPPSDVGGSAVSEYYAVVNPGNIVATSVTPPVSVTGLTNGVEYTTKVWANNNSGPSPYSAESNFTPAPEYVEDVFSTYLYQANGASQDIVNGMNLPLFGGMTWIKERNSGDDYHLVFDTVRGEDKYLSTNTATNQATNNQTLKSFNSDGFSVGISDFVSRSGGAYASWTFRKAKKFFDIVTYTGTGSVQNIVHNLGSVPGCIITKKLDGGGSGSWNIYHRSTGNTQWGRFDTNSFATASTVWNSTDPTDTHFTVGTSTAANTAGVTYVAYLFAHDAGGFGDDGLQNIISCGSYTGASGISVDLGYEPQWLLIKNSNTSSTNWIILDTTRGILSGYNDSVLFANTVGAELKTALYGSVNPTGFSPLGLANTSGDFYVYIAIRRGPMKTPTTAENVFQPIAYTGTGTNNRLVDTSIFIDMSLTRTRTSAGSSFFAVDRFRGDAFMATNATAGDVVDADSFMSIVPSGYGYSFSAMNGFGVGADATRRVNVASQNQISYAFKTAPEFFDMVAYTGNGSSQNVSHNLGVTPELMIVKRRNTSGDWRVYHPIVGVNASLKINSIDIPQGGSAFWDSTAPTSAVFTVGTSPDTNASGGTYIAYLFASCPNVSKVGSYTGTGPGNLQTIDCGFTSGARLVLIKRTDVAGDWYVWDSARGITSGNDPYITLNSTSGDVTNTNYIDTESTGFQITDTAPTALNAVGGTFIFFAIA